jgi:hypothetical protein
VLAKSDTHAYGQEVHFANPGGNHVKMGSRIYSLNVLVKVRLWILAHISCFQPVKRILLTCSNHSWAVSLEINSRQLHTDLCFDLFGHVPDERFLGLNEVVLISVVLSSTAN